MELQPKAGAGPVFYLVPGTQYQVPSRKTPVPVNAVKAEAIRRGNGIASLSRSVAKSFSRRALLNASSSALCTLHPGLCTASHVERLSLRPESCFIPLIPFIPVKLRR